MRRKSEGLRGAGAEQAPTFEASRDAGLMDAPWDEGAVDEAGASGAAANKRPMLRVEGIDFAYPDRANTLNDVSFEVAAGELVTLLGPNGSGKSTLLNCVMHLHEPQRGCVKLDGVPVRELSHREIARAVAYVPQTVNVTFAYDVRDYVAMGRAPFLKMYESPGPQDYELVDAALGRLGIAELSDRPYPELSGGQRQLVDVARALAQGPRLILFDEPTSALDYGNQVKVLRMISELSREGYAIVMTTHNPDHPILLGSSVCLLDRTGHLEKGGVDEIMQEDRLERVYECGLMIREVPDAGRRVCITPSFR